MGVALRRNRDFLALVAGQSVSLLGDRLHYLAVIALLATMGGGLTGPAASMRLSVIALCTTIPVILFAGVAGTLVDRRRKKTVLVTCDALRAVLVLLLPLSQALGGGLPAAVCVIAALYTINVFFLPARAAILPELVPEDRLIAANAVTTSGNILATIAGTAAGGAIIQAAGYAWGFYLDAVSYALSVAAMSMIRSTPPPPRESHVRGAPVWATLAGGLRAIVRLPRVGVAVALFGALYVVGASLFVLAPPAVARITPAATRAMGFLIAALASGAIAGSAIVARLGSRRGDWTASAVGMLIAGGAIAGLALARSVGAMAACAAVAGLGAAPLMVTSDVILQRDVAPNLRARVFAARDAIVKSAFLLTAVGVGVLAARVLPGDILLVEGCLLVLGGVLMGARRGALARADLAPGGGEAIEPGLARHVAHVDERAADGAVVRVNGLDEVVQVALRDRV